MKVSGNLSSWMIIRYEYRDIICLCYGRCVAIPNDRKSRGRNTCTNKCRKKIACRLQDSETRSIRGAQNSRQRGEKPLNAANGAAQSGECEITASWHKRLLDKRDSARQWGDNAKLRSKRERERLIVGKSLLDGAAYRSRLHR